jgi:hypothetical protein
MARDIRFAGLDERMRRQVMQTVQLIYNSYDKASAAEWDETVCDVLVADADRASGRAAMAAADALDVAVIAVTDDSTQTGYPSVSRNATAASLTRLVRSLLTDKAAA